MAVIVVGFLAALSAVVLIEAALCMAAILAGTVTNLVTWVGLSFDPADQAVIIRRCHPAFVEAVVASRGASMTSG